MGCCRHRSTWPLPSCCVLRCVACLPSHGGIHSTTTLHASKVQEGRKRKLADVSAVTFANWQSVSGGPTYDIHKFFGVFDPLPAPSVPSALKIYALFIFKFGVFSPFPLCLDVMYGSPLGWELGSYLIDCLGKEKEGTGDVR